MSQALGEQQQGAQLWQLPAWLGQGLAGEGRHKPVLSVGRYGTTLGVRIMGRSVF